MADFEQIAREIHPDAIERQSFSASIALREKIAAALREAHAAGVAAERERCAGIIRHGVKFTPACGQGVANLHQRDVQGTGGSHPRRSTPARGDIMTRILIAAGVAMAAVLLVVAALIILTLPIVLFPEWMSWIAVGEMLAILFGIAFVSAYKHTKGKL